jgi:hypothetical protein
MLHKSTHDPELEKLLGPYKLSFIYDFCRYSKIDCTFYASADDLRTRCFIGNNYLFNKDYNSDILFFNSKDLTTSYICYASSKDNIIKKFTQFSRLKAFL